MKRKQPVGQPQKYTDEILDMIINDFEQWIYGTYEEINAEGETITKPNLFYFNYVQRVQETFGLRIPAVLNSIRKSNPERYVAFQSIKDILAEKLISYSMQGHLKENSTKFYLMARHQWSEKIETKNENVNTQIVWNEQKTYSNTENTENQSVENENNTE